MFWDNRNLICKPRNEVITECKKYMQEEHIELIHVLWTMDYLIEKIESDLPNVNYSLGLNEIFMNYNKYGMVLSNYSMFLEILPLIQRHAENKHFAPLIGVVEFTKLCNSNKMSTNQCIEFAKLDLPFYIMTAFEIDSFMKHYKIKPGK